MDKRKKRFYKARNVVISPTQTKIRDSKKKDKQINKKGIVQYPIVAVKVIL